MRKHFIAATLSVLVIFSCSPSRAQGIAVYPLTEFASEQALQEFSETLNVITMGGRGKASIDPVMRTVTVKANSVTEQSVKDQVDIFNSILSRQIDYDVTVIEAADIDPVAIGPMPFGSPLVAVGEADALPNYLSKFGKVSVKHSKITAQNRTSIRITVPDAGVVTLAAGATKTVAWTNYFLSLRNSAGDHLDTGGSAGIPNGQALILSSSHNRNAVYVVIAATIREGQPLKR